MMELSDTFAKFEDVCSMSYPDFVALMKQDNTLPSGNYTVDYWIAC